METELEENNRTIAVVETEINTAAALYVSSTVNVVLKIRRYEMGKF
jgi:hypothetical protein